MLPKLVEADCLSFRLTIQPGEVGDELYLSRIQMMWDSTAVSTWHIKCQAQFFELYWLLRVPERGRKEQSRYSKPSIQFECAE
jgi:hypothetical protein